MLALFSRYVRADNIYFGIGSRALPFGKEPFTRLTVCSPCELSISNFGYFPFWFQGQGSNCTSSWPLLIFFRFSSTAKMHEMQSFCSHLGCTRLCSHPRLLHRSSTVARRVTKITSTHHGGP